LDSNAYKCPLHCTIHTCTGGTLYIMQSMQGLPRPGSEAATSYKYQNPELRGPAQAEAREGGAHRPE
jgi:hypothetical protein